MAPRAGDTDLDLEPIVTPGLGDVTYVLRSAGEVAVIDAQRDTPRRLRESKRPPGGPVRWIVETHVHNDYVSGALEVQRTLEGEVAAPEAGGYGFGHRGLREGDELPLGELRLEAVATPGHTPEHLAFLVRGPGSDRPIAAFTGGSLIAGGAGRSDLLGPERAEELAGAQFRSLRRLADLEDEVLVLPTHGGGSFCVVGPDRSGQRTSTMGRERGDNPALAAAMAGDEGDFVRDRLSGLLAFPAYYRHMAPINRAGPAVMGPVPPARPLRPDELASAGRAGGWVVDGRPRQEFAAGHVPGSLNVELDDRFASYVGWIVPFGSPIALVLPGPAEAEAEASGTGGSVVTSWERAVTELHRVGYERVLGFLDGGLGAWRGQGRDVASYPTATIDQLCEARRAGRAAHLLDVRQRQEWGRGHARGSHHVFVGDLPGRLDEVPRDGEVWVACASGHRSAIAASLLDRDGVTVRLVTPRGIRDLLRGCPEEAAEVPVQARIS